MPDRTIVRFAQTRARPVFAVLVLTLAATGSAWPQATQPQAPAASQIDQPQAQPTTAAPEQATPQQASPAPASPPPASENPGLINELGKLFENSTSILPTLKSPRETFDDLNTRAKDATDSLSRLAKQGVVTGRVVCPVSSNGAPDCKAASDKLCRTKGFKEGKSLDTDAAQTCSAKPLLQGRKPEPGECRTDNYVIRALCQ